MDRPTQPSNLARQRPTTHRRTFWLVMRHRSAQVEVLAAELTSGKLVLPVFSFAEEAHLFLLLLGGFDDNGLARDGWWVRRTEAGELISMLLGPCRGIERVALDPLPEVGAELVNRLVSLDRKSFLDLLTGKADAR